MEMLRTLKGPSTGEVSVHLVARDSPGSGSHLPTAAFIIPGGPSQGSGGTGESTSMPKQMWVLGRRRYFSPASALAWQGWSRVVRLTCVVSVHVSVRSQLGRPGSAQQCPGCVLLSAGADARGHPGASGRQRTCHSHSSAAVKHRAGGQPQRQHSAALGVDRGRSPAFGEWPAGQ